MSLPATSNVPGNGFTPGAEELHAIPGRDRRRPDQGPVMHCLLIPTEMGILILVMFVVAVTVGGVVLAVALGASRSRRQAQLPPSYYPNYPQMPGNPPNGAHPYPGYPSDPRAAQQPGYPPQAQPGWDPRNGYPPAAPYGQTPYPQGGTPQAEQPSTQPDQPGREDPRAE